MRARRGSASRSAAAKNKKGLTADGRLTIAIDGPAGAGKSTSARDLANALGLRYIDTGAMYRGVAWAVVRAGVAPDDRRRVRSLLARTALSFTDEAEPRLLVDGHDASAALRSPDVSQAASRLATVPEVRTFLVRAQRRLARGGGVVMEGRDIGTVVLPRADVKFFLDASVEERARRRWKQLGATGRSEPRSAIEAAIRERDHRDRTRAVSPLRAADDAVVLDTTRDSRARVKRMLLDWVRRKTGVR
ncbi:MAG: (d)CMP kinase [Elusimicrobia bacterium]|nr:(d)CMP kinase [Elusimicrobiota bacterium]